MGATWGKDESGVLGTAEGRQSGSDLTGPWRISLRNYEVEPVGKSGPPPHIDRMPVGEKSVCDERFLGLLGGRLGEHAEQHEASVFGLLPDLTIGYLNPAWFRFARDNGGEEVSERWGLGAPVLEAMHGPVRALFEREYRLCFEKCRAWQHDYECSSPRVFREFHMDVFAIGGARGLLVINTLTAEHPHGSDRVAMKPEESLYLDEHGLILQCGYCRRIQRSDGSERWEWIPEWVENQPDNVTGGLCVPCYQTRFPSGSQ